VRNQPNILLIMTDQHRWDALSAVSDWLSTPHLDRIASEGLRAARAYTNSPVCVPARISLVTGQRPHKTGVWDNGMEPDRGPTRTGKGTRHSHLEEDAATWMRSVRDAGYSTSVFGKTHLHRQVGDLRERTELLHSWGLDHVDEIAGPRAATRSSSNLTDLWEKRGVRDAYVEDVRHRVQHDPLLVRPSPLPLDLNPDVYVGQQASAWLRDYADSRPWMCWVSFSGPHEPWDCPEPYASRFDPATMPAPLVASRKSGTNRPRGLFDERKDLSIPPETVARLRADYAGKLALIDDQVGELLQVLEERGELEDTVVAMVSDHGEMNGDFGMVYKQNFLDPSARIPFLLRGPGIPAGRVLDDPVELMDMGATLVDLAGAKRVPRSHARSLMRTLRGKRERHRGAALCEYRGEIMVVTPEWKMALNKAGAPYLLYDLAADPHETRNLAGGRRHRRTETRLATIMLAELASTLY
jgi:arylsulfatase